MQNLIDTVSQAIADGTLSMTDAVNFTIALANGSWGVIAKLAHQVAQFV